MKALRVQGVMGWKVTRLPKPVHEGPLYYTTKTSEFPVISHAPPHILCAAMQRLMHRKLSTCPQVAEESTPPTFTHEYAVAMVLPLTFFPVFLDAEAVLEGDRLDSSKTYVIGLCDANASILPIPTGSDHCPPY